MELFAVVTAKYAETIEVPDISETAPTVVPGKTSYEVTTGYGSMNIPSAVIGDDLEVGETLIISINRNK